MKKLLMAALLCAASIMAYGYQPEPEVVDTYSFTMSAKMPFVSKGVRTYASQSLKGTMVVEYADAEVGPSKVYIDVKNSKTKVEHRIWIDEGILNMMGKTTSKAYRSVPTVCWTGFDTNIVGTTQSAHEKFISLMFAGNGALKYIKGTGCDFCGDGVPSCNKVKSLSGYFTGIVDCQCPDNESWDHTIEANACGIQTYQTGEAVRTHDAAVWGSWSAKLISTETNERTL